MSKAIFTTLLALCIGCGGSNAEPDAPTALNDVQVVEQAATSQPSSQPTSQPTSQSTEALPQVCAENADCGDVTMFCMMDEGACQEDGAEGVCTSIPQICTMQYDPVCGCDGETHGNACGAYAAGTSVAFRGPCDGSAPF